MKKEKPIRIIARLDIKGPNVIKGIQFECLRVMGKPADLAQEYYLQGADELIYLDTVASLYQRDNLLQIVKEASKNIFVPFTAGGGVRTIEDIRNLLSAGAEKVAINTAATKNPELIRRAARTFGSQCIVVSIEAKKQGESSWEAYTDNGRQSTGLDVVKWAKKAEMLGAGEILLTSVDQEGTERGLDLELINEVAKTVSIPVIASGGVSSPDDAVKGLKAGADAVAIASVLHYKKYDIDDIKKVLAKEKVPVRLITAKKLKSGSGIAQRTDYNTFTLQHLSGKIGLSADQIKNKIRPMTKKVTDSIPLGIIDYKINNVLSVQRAFQKIGQEARIISTPQEIMKAQALVLPGVGAFRDGMRALKKYRLIEPLKKRVEQKTPLLGICLGMQMLFSESYEFGRHKGLGLIEGKVIRFSPPSQVRQPGYKLPHIGWNQISLLKKNGWKGTLLEGPANRGVYYVHSYYPQVKNKKLVLAMTEYGGQKFCAVVQKDNIIGTQFHPEKSGVAGLEILKNFCKKYLN